MNINSVEWMRDELNPKTMILLRGLPSCGKSTRARELAGGDESIIFSADKFWGNTPEEYVLNWNKDKLYTAHTWCQNLTRAAMQRQSPLVIVDNTNVRLSEMMVYFGMAVQYQYRVRIEEPVSPWWVNDIAPLLTDKEANRDRLDELAKMLAEKSRDTHRVPYESIRKMLFRYQPNVTFEDLVSRYFNRSESVETEV